MPTYEYRCKDCGHTFEAYQSFSDDPLTECTACGGTVKKVFGNVGIAFKGSGFYKTDSRGGSKSAGVAGSTSSTKTDTSSGSGGASTPSSSESSGGGSKGDSTPSPAAPASSTP